MFDRMIEIYGSKHMRMLTIQYRMNTEINEFPSHALYRGKLVAAPEVARRRLFTQLGIKETENTSQAVVFVDTQGGDFPESTPDDKETLTLNESKRNQGEARIVKEMIEDLVSAKVSPYDIAVVTPYNAQVYSLFFLPPFILLIICLSGIFDERVIEGLPGY